jgi:5-methylcytosine-specific restriction endonuclease McrA
MGYNRRTFTNETFIEAVKSSISVRSTLQYLGLVASGGNYIMVKRLIKELVCNINHWKGQGHWKGKHTSAIKPIPLSDIMKEDRPYNSGRLLKRMVKEKIIEYKCSICGAKEWLGKSLTLHLHHINGNHVDNRLENLQILCPNCHSQTATYCGRGIKDRRKIKEKRKLPNLKPKPLCVDCGKERSKESSARCRQCADKHKRGFCITKIQWPSIEELLNRLKTTSYLQLGKELGISDNSIRKHIKKHSLVPAP